MADDTITKQIEIKTNTPAAKKALEELEKQLDRLQKTISALKVGNLEQGMESLGDGVTRVTKALGGLNSLTGITDTVDDLAKASNKASSETAELADELQHMGKEVDKAAQLASSGLDDLTGSTEKSGDAANEAGKKQEKHSEGLDKAFKAATLLNQAMDLAVKVFKAVKGAVNVVTDAYIEAEQAEVGLMNALKVQGQYSEAAMDDFKAFARELQNTATIGDETTLSLLRIGKALGLTNQESKDAVTAAAALSAATGDDLNASFEKVTKTFGGLAGELAQKVPELKSLTQAQLQAGAATQVLIDKFGQFLGITRQTFGGQQAATIMAFGDVLEEIGRLVVEVFDLRSNLAGWEEFFIQAGQAVDDLRKKLLYIQETVNFDKLIAMLQQVGLALGIVAVAVGTVLAPATILAIKVVAITAGVLALIVALDALIRLAPQLGTVFEGVGHAIQAMAAAGAQMFTDFIKSIFENLRALQQAAIDMGVLIPDSISDGIDRGMAAVEQRAAGASKYLEKEFNYAANAAANSFDSIDTSNLATELVSTFDKVNGALSNMDKNTQAVAESQGKVAESTRKIVTSQADLTEALKQQEEIRKGLEDRNKQLQLDIATFNKGQIAQLEAKLKVELETLKAKKDQLEVEGKLTGEVGNQIKQQMELQEKLLKQSTAQQISQAESPNIIDANQLEKLGGVLGQGAADIAGGIGSSIAAFSNPVSAMMGAANAFADAIQQLIDFIPQILNKIADIFNSVTDLPNKILEAVGNVFKSITRLISEGVANFIKFIPQFFSDILTFVFEELPNAIIQLVSDLPGIIMDGFIGKLPELINRLISGLVVRSPEIAISLINALITTVPELVMALMKALYVELPMAFMKAVQGLPEMILNLLETLPDKLLGGFLDNLPQFIDGFVGGLLIKMPTLAMSLVETLIKSAPKIAIAFVSALYIELPKAFIKALREALSNVGNLLAGTFKKAMPKAPKIDVKPLEEAVDKVFKKVVTGATGVAEQVFGAIDIPAGGIKDAVKEPAKILDNVVAEIGGAMSAAGKYIKGLWDQFLDLLKKAWLWVWEKVLSPIVEIVKIAWLWVYDTVIEPIISIVKIAWQFVVDLFDSLAKFVKLAWQFIIDYFNAFVDVIKAAWQFVIDFWNTFTDLIQNAWSAVFKFFEGLFSIVEAAWKTVIDFFSLLFQGKVTEAFGAVFSFFANLGTMLADAFKPIIDFFNQTVGVLTDFFENKLLPFIQVAVRPFIVAFEFLKDAITQYLQPAITALSSIFNVLKESVNKLFSGDPFNTLKNAVDKLFGGDPFRTIEKAVNQLFGNDIFSPLANALESIIGPFKDLADSLKNFNPGNLGGGGGGDGGTLGEIRRGLGFAKGGLVYAADGLYVPQGTDTVPAMLTPGEFVLRRPAVQSIGSDAASYINRTGQLPATVGRQTQNVTFNFDQGSIVIQGAQDPERITDQLIEEIKRRSIRGDFVFSTSGGRVTR